MTSQSRRTRRGRRAILVEVGDRVGEEALEVEGGVVEGSEEEEEEDVGSKGTSMSPLVGKIQKRTLQIVSKRRKSKMLSLNGSSLRTFYVGHVGLCYRHFGSRRGKGRRLDTQI